MTGADPLEVRGLARRVGRDMKGVHTDAQALVACGVIEKTEDGKLLFPYDEVRLELRLKAAWIRLTPVVGIGAWGIPRRWERESPSEWR